MDKKRKVMLHAVLHNAIIIVKNSQCTFFPYPKDIVR